MAKEKTTSIIPSVLAYERKLSPSDGLLFGTKWNDRNCVPLRLSEKSVRGTFSNRFGKNVSVEKRAANVCSANLQRIDSCALPSELDTLCLKYSLKFLPCVGEPSACNNSEFYEKQKKLISEYINEYGFKELASRYAHNIASARALWRNRIGAVKIETIVAIEGGEKMTFDSSAFSTKRFDRADEIARLSEQIASALCGKTPHCFMQVESFALIGGGQEVFPSEELVFNKDKNARDEKSKILYEVDGCAAMHSQKIGNAIRTIDTWYPNYEGFRFGPIAAEVYGTVSARNVAFRKESGSDFYSLFDEAVEEGKFRTADEAHYVMAVLVRGGVFGGKTDDGKSDKKSAEKGGD